MPVYYRDCLQRLSFLKEDRVPSSTFLSDDSLRFLSSAPPEISISSPVAE